MTDGSKAEAPGSTRGKPKGGVQQPVTTPGTAPSSLPTGPSPAPAAQPSAFATAPVPTPAPPQPSPDPARQSGIRARVVVRKVDPWSVLKVSLVFYTCVMIIVFLALWILYSMAVAAGTVDRLTTLMVKFSLVEKGFRINGGWLVSRSLLIGFGLVVLWSLINLFVAFLYNLISAVVGGLEVTLAERR